MTDFETGRTQIRFARLAGFMFLFVIVADLAGMAMSGGYAVPGNLAETIHRMMGGELLIRIGFSSGFIGSICTVFLATGLYVAVKPIDGNLALLALLFRLAEATLGGAQSVFNFAFLKLYVGSDSLSVAGASQLQTLMTLQSAANSVSMNIAAILFSIGSTLFFYLFFKSNYIPKVLSVLGFFASPLVTIVSFASLIFPQPSKMLQFGWLPIAAAEITVGLWLLFKGINLPPQEN
jgi:NADH:ubiquinone oxidoreductase subunit K